MKLNYSKQTLALAVSLACANSAFALDLATLYNEADTADQVTLRIAGASAQDNGLENLMRLNVAGSTICAPGTLDLYRTIDKNARLFYCTGGANSGAAGKRLAVFKRSNGGSGTGVGTLVRAGTVTLDDASTVAPNFLKTDATVSGVAGVVVPAAGNLAQFTLHGAVANANTTAAPLNAADVGISDVEPAQFGAIFNPDLTAIEKAALNTTTFGTSSVIFGVPVTKGLYERLQAVEFAAANVCNPNNVGYGAVANTEACVPSLTKAQLQGIYTQQIPSWDAIQSANTAGVNVANVTTPNYPTTLENGGDGDGLADIYLERRALSSGTEASFEIYFNAQRCINGAQTMATKALGGKDNGGAGIDLVVENSSGSTIPTNLTTHDTANRGAVGILSTEIVAAAGDKWRFIKINGAAPTILNVVKSSYDLFFENTLQYRGASVNGLPALGGLQQAVANAIRDNIGKPDVISAVDVPFTQLFGRAGLLGNAVRNAGDAPVAPFVTSGGTQSDVLTNPVALKTRGASGTVNACLPPVTINNSQANAGP